MTPEVLARTHAEAFAAPWTAQAFADLLAQAGVFVLGDDDGFVLIRVVVDEAEMLTLAVRPSARRRGLGAALTRAGAAAAGSMGAERLFLEVAEDNVAARGLYQGLGFATIGRRRGYYAAPDGGRVDAIMMSLSPLETVLGLPTG